MCQQKIKMMRYLEIVKKKFRINQIIQILNKKLVKLIIRIFKMEKINLKKIIFQIRTKIISRSNKKTEKMNNKKNMSYSAKKLLFLRKKMKI